MIWSSPRTLRRAHLVAALEQWPTAGVPENPSAWPMTTAKRRGIDHFRRAGILRHKLAELEHAGGEEEEGMPDLDAQVDHIETTFCGSPSCPATPP